MACVRGSNDEVTVQESLQRVVDSISKMGVACGGGHKFRTEVVNDRSGSRL